MICLPFLAFSGPDDLYYVPNLGQWPEAFLYKSGVKDCDIYLEQNCVTYVLADPTNSDKVHEFHHDKTLRPILRYHSYKMFFDGANVAQTLGNDPKKFYHNYFLGNDQDKWKTGIHPFSSVSYQQLYPGIEGLFKADNGHFAYDFIVAPNADPSLIKLRFEGTDGLRIVDGKLQIQNSIKNIEESKPYTYQLINGEKREIACIYVLNGNTVSFSFPDGYDKSKELVIDPTVVFASFTGSSISNYGFSATYDDLGNAYGGGEIFGVGYPTTTGAFQMTFQGGSTDINITKFSSTGSTVIYATYLGGSNGDQPHSMVVDPAGNLVVTGVTNSANYPVTTGAYDNSFNGLLDLVVTKFNSTGTGLIGSTYMGGSGTDGGNMFPLSNNYGDAFRGEVITDDYGNIYVAGNTQSTNFPTVNATQAALNGGMDGVVFKLNNTLSNLIWSTYLGGSDVDAAYVLSLSNTGSNVYVSGGTASTNFPTTTGAYHTTYQGGTVDGFITRYVNGGSYGLLSGTYIGTNDYDQSYGVQVDKFNGVYAMGQSAGPFPVVGAVYSNPGSGQFVMKLDSTLNILQFSTVVGNGSNTTPLSPTAFLVDSCLNIYFSGWGTTTGYPITTNTLFSTSDGSDFYFFTLSPNAGSLLFGSYYGSSGWDHVDGGTSRFDKSGIIYQGICSAAPTYPGSNFGAYPNNLDGYSVVTIKINFEVGPVYAIASANNVSGCSPLTVQFQNNSSNATSYVWDFGDGSALDTNATPSHTYGPGVYTVTLIANSTTACNTSDSTTLTITVDTGDVVADFTSQLVDSCGPYTASFTNTSSVVSTTATYQWDFGNGVTFSGANPSLQTYPDTGAYTITLIVNDTAGLCTEADTVTYTINFNSTSVVASADPSPSGRGCSPFVVQFTNNSTSADTYAWDFGDGSPVSNQSNPSHTFTNIGTYTIMLISTNSQGTVCNTSDTDYLTIIVDSGDVAADFTAVVTDSCDPYIATVTNLSPYTTSATIFTWNFGDGTTFTGPNPGPHNYPGTGTYTITLIIEDSTSCNKIDSISRMVIITNIFVDVSFPPIPDVCGVYDINFSGESVNGTSYWWDLGDGNTSTLNSFTHTYEPGQYDVTVVAYNALACNGSDTMKQTINIRQQAIADFIYTPEVPERNKPISFTNLSQFADTYLWDFGDGSNSTDVNPVKLFNRDGDFLICLTANNKDNCPDSICRSIFSDILPLADIPTAFSPNGDGQNDMLYVRGVGMANLHLMIFNRWGELVFETTTIETDLVGQHSAGWDGRMRGEEQPMEAYAYVLEIRFVDNNTLTKKGNITLLR